MLISSKVVQWKTKKQNEHVVAGPLLDHYHLPRLSSLLIDSPFELDSDVYIRASNFSALLRLLFGTWGLGTQSSQMSESACFSGYRQEGPESGCALLSEERSKLTCGCRCFPCLLPPIFVGVLDAVPEPRRTHSMSASESFGSQAGKFIGLRRCFTIPSAVHRGSARRARRDYSRIVG